MELEIKADDVFGNILRLQKLQRDIWSDELKHGEDREDWIFPVYGSNIAIYWYWNEVIAPSGKRMIPLYLRYTNYSPLFESIE